MEANNQEQDQDLDVVKVTPEESIDENTDYFNKKICLTAFWLGRWGLRKSARFYADSAQWDFSIFGP